MKRIVRIVAVIEICCQMSAVAWWWFPWRFPSGQTERVVTAGQA